MTCLPAQQSDAAFSHLVDSVSMLITFDDDSPLVPRVLPVFLSAISSVLPVTMDETSWSLLKIVADQRVRPVYP